MTRVLILNGPNLNLLGTREPEVYGTTTLGELETLVAGWGQRLGVNTTFQQSNHEGDLVDAIQAASGVDGLVINPGALSHTSRSLGDAILSAGMPAVEVHISNVKARERWRSVSFVSDAVDRTIYGRGMSGYRDALRHLVNRAAVPSRTIRYGPHTENVADLRVPAADAAGLVTLVHGGFWLREWERDSMETIAVDLTRRGLATLNVEYRRLGIGGGWPGSAHDVLSAIEYAFLDSELSAKPQALIGHSAGGHLALWASDRCRNGSVALAIGLAAVTDLGELANSSGPGAPQAQTLLQHGAPTAIDTVPANTLLVHGSSDDLVPVSHSTRLADQAGVDIVEGLGHFHLLDPALEHWPAVVASLETSFS
jgi:3-dehydroquinate dehydratase-2